MFSNINFDITVIAKKFPKRTNFLEYMNRQKVKKRKLYTPVTSPSNDENENEANEKAFERQPGLPVVKEIPEKKLVLKRYLFFLISINLNEIAEI